MTRRLDSKARAAFVEAMRPLVESTSGVRRRVKPNPHVTRLIDGINAERAEQESMMDAIQRVIDADGLPDMGDPAAVKAFVKRRKDEERGAAS